MALLDMLRGRAVRRATRFLPGLRLLGGPRGARATGAALQDASRELGGPGALARELVLGLPGIVVALSKLARDPRVPRRYRAALLAIVPWLASPIDPIPDFIPVLGAMDDALLASLVVRWVIRGVDRDILAEHWSGSPILLRLLERSAGRGAAGSGNDAAGD